MSWFNLLFIYGDWALLALRVAVGAIFLVHGKAKFAMWKVNPSEQMSVGMLSLMRFLSIAETLGGLAILAGFLTPLAALGLMIVMLGALRFKIFVWKTPFMELTKNGWEFDLVLLASNLISFVFGPGKIALDAILWP